uniref:CUB and zona pellucida-like domain-containing protein 1 n=1 Tax=Malurus cyaneus samueli TaxID=2593467 RepID=A0A8C5U981_9PASS
MQLLRQFLLLPLFTALALPEDNSIEFSGMEIWVPRCGASLHEPNKALRIELNANANCIWQIQRNTNQTIRLIFSHFKFAPSSSCETESIKVFDGPSTNSPLLGQVCNDTDAVPVLESSSDSLTFLITTNSVAFTRNFCLLLLLFTRINSPNYPAPYPGFRYCVWHIQAPKNSKINLQFQDFFLELDRNCQLDFTAVYDGPTTDSRLLGKVCGRAQPTFESSSNMMTVVLSTDDATSYRGFSAQYSTTLTCPSYSMRIVLSKSYLASLGFSEAQLQLNDPSCRPTVTDSEVIFSFPLASCGTIKKEMDESHSITYTNTITLAPAGNVITRQKNTEIIAECRISNNATLEVIYVTKNNAIQKIIAGGRYNISMAFYESDFFSKPIQYFPYYVDLNQTLYVAATLHSTDPNLQVFIDTCTASPQEDFGSLTYDLIRNGCNKDDTVVTYPAFENQGRFKFRAFRFLRSFPTVYLQCNVVICDSSNTNSRCARGCITRQKRDIAPYTWKTNTVVGPIRLKRDLRAAEHSGKTEAEKTPKLQQYNFYTLAFVVLISNILIVVAVILKHHKHQARYSYSSF